MVFIYYLFCKIGWIAFIGLVCLIDLGNFFELKKLVLIYEQGHITRRRKFYGDIYSSGAREPRR